MKLSSLIGRLMTAANVLEDRGFGFHNGRTAEEMSRYFATGTFPLRLFLAWLERCPEAREEIAETLLTLKDTATEPAPTGHDFAATHEAATAAGLKNPATYGEPTIDVASFLKPEPNGGYTGEKPAQKSEPPVSPSGVRGAQAPSLTVNIGNAANLLGRSEFTTRPVSPKDSEPSSLGMAQGFRGHAAITDGDGKPVRALAKFNDKTERVVEFLDKRGPLILARFVGGDQDGAVINICIEYVEPRDRARVLSYLKHLPGSEDGFNFSPFDGGRDPWTGGEITHATTVEPRMDVE